MRPVVTGMGARIPERLPAALRVGDMHQQRFAAVRDVGEDRLQEWVIHQEGLSGWRANLHSDVLPDLTPDSSGRKVPFQPVNCFADIRWVIEAREIESSAPGKPVGSRLRERTVNIHLLSPL